MCRLRLMAEESSCLHSAAASKRLLPSVELSQCCHRDMPSLSNCLQHPLKERARRGAVPPKAGGSQHACCQASSRIGSRIFPAGCDDGRALPSIDAGTVDQASIGSQAPTVLGASTAADAGCHAGPTPTIIDAGIAERAKVTIGSPAPIELGASTAAASGCDDGEALPSIDAGTADWAPIGSQAANLGHVGMREAIG